MSNAAVDQRSGSGSSARYGLLAFGDSITNGGGELQWGVALQSWALWTARALGLPFTSYATDGARAGDVVATQIPAFLERAAAPAGPYDVGCLYIGVNDVRALEWDVRAYDADLRRALEFLAVCCDRLLTLTIPLDLGRPRAGAKVEEANAVIERAAADHGALVADLRGFGGRHHVMADHVHPTAFGQIAMAERALGVLAADGLVPKVAPSALISYETTPVGRVRGAVTYGYRRAKVEAKGRARQLAAQLAVRAARGSG
jgi:lysophospholipase L1-like esterase